MGIGETPPPEPIEEPPKPPVEGHEHMHFFLPVAFNEKGEAVPLDVPGVDSADSDHGHGDHDRGDHDHGHHGSHDHKK